LAGAWQTAGRFCGAPAGSALRAVLSRLARTQGTASWSDQAFHAGRAGPAPGSPRGLDWILPEDSASGKTPSSQARDRAAKSGHERQSVAKSMLDLAKLALALQTSAASLPRRRGKTMRKAGTGRQSSTLQAEDGPATGRQDASWPSCAGKRFAWTRHRRRSACVRRRPSCARHPTSCNRRFDHLACRFCGDNMAQGFSIWYVP